MILQVAVSRELIEQWFTTGHTMRGVLRVKEGVPAGAELKGTRMDVLEERVWLLFETPGDPGALQDQNIIVESNRELAELEAQLAYENACISIGCAAIKQEDGWFHLAAEDVECGNLVDEIRYLELRGDLERHPSDPSLIKLSPDAEGVDAVPQKTTPEVTS